jgi:hypothetical protein
MRALANSNKKYPGAMRLAAGAMKSLGYCNNGMSNEFVGPTQAWTARC